MSATGSDHPLSTMKDMEKDLSCYICLQVLTDPKELTCSHVFCLACLEDWVGDQPRIDCPECRHVTMVPQGGLSNLKTNLRLRSMVEKYAARKRSLKNVPICEIHEGEQQFFFCVTCGVPVCQACVVVQHDKSQHDIKELKDTTRIRKNQMKATLQDIQAKVTKYDTEENRLEEMERQIQMTIKREMQKVDNHLSELVVDARAMSTQAKTSIQQRGNEYLEEIRRRKNTTKDQKRRLTYADKAAQKITENTPDHLYVVQHASLNRKIRQLACVEDMIFEPAAEDFYFYASNVKDWFGRVGSRRRKLSLCAEFGNGTFKAAHSVASSKSGFLAVVDPEIEKFYIYRKRIDKFGHQLSFDQVHENTTSAVQVATLEDNKFVIAESLGSGGSIKVFQATGQYERTLPNVKGNRIATCVSMKNNENEFIVVGNSRKRTIGLYRSNGQLVRVHSNISIAPKNTIATNGKQIALSNADVGKVCVIDFESGHEVQTLNIEKPHGLCFDDQSDSIMISNRFNGKWLICQYCCISGRLLTRLTANFNYAFSMIITHNGKLAVADDETVKIFDFE